MQIAHTGWAEGDPFSGWRANIEAFSDSSVIPPDGTELASLDSIARSVALCTDGRTVELGGVLPHEQELARWCLFFFRSDQIFMEYTTANEAKASFDDVYNAPTPHGYLQTMDGLGYRIGDHAKPFFEKTLGHMRASNPDQYQPRFLDLGCSYGIGSALLIHGCSYQSLSEFFLRQPDRDFENCVSATQDWLDERSIRSDAECVGLDQAANAVRFGERTGLLARGIVSNLEEGDSFSSDEESCIRRCNILISTGAIGYVGPKTLGPILRLLGKATPENVGPLIVATVLRMFDPTLIQECFREHGFAFEKVSDKPLPQRKFESEEEQADTIALLKKRGISTTGLEETGVLYADVYAGAREPDFSDFATTLESVAHTTATE